MAKPTNTRTITAAADVMMRPERCRPLRTATSLGSPRVDVFLDARQQEHFVVHRQPEAEGDDHNQYVGLDAARRRELQRPLQMPVGEYPGHDSKVAPSESALITSVFTGTSSDPVIRNNSTKVASTTSPSAPGRTRRSASGQSQPGWPPVRPRTTGTARRAPATRATRGCGVRAGLIGVHGQRRPAVAMPSTSWGRCPGR